MIGDCNISDVVLKFSSGSVVSTSAKMGVEPAFGTLSWEIQGAKFLGDIGHFVWNLAPEEVLMWSSVEIEKYICFAFEGTTSLKLGIGLSCHFWLQFCEEKLCGIKRLTVPTRHRIMLSERKGVFGRRSTRLCGYCWLLCCSESSSDYNRASQPASGWEGGKQQGRESIFSSATPRALFRSSWRGKSI